MDELLSVVANEFWPIILLLLLSTNKKWRVGAVMLVALRISNGRFNWWGTMAVTIFIIFKTWWWDPIQVPKKTDDSSTARKDPDQLPRR